MDSIVGLVGRDDLVADLVAEIRKGKHVILTGGIGMGKSTVLKVALEKVRDKVDLVICLHDHQAKGQFVEMVRQMLRLGLLTAEQMSLPVEYHDIPPAQIEWSDIRNRVNRMSMRDLTQLIIPALADSEVKPIIAVDDLTTLTPTQMMFWLAIFEHAQVLGCASEKKPRIKKLWWKMKEIQIKPLPVPVVKKMVKDYITAKGMLIESPEQFISHVVKQSGGIPQAIFDMLEESSKERVIDKRTVRAMRHDAGVRYLDFTPMIMLLGALIVSMRYIGMGTGDKTLYIMGGMGAALFLTFKFFIFKGVGR